MASVLKWVSELYGKKLIILALLINIDVCLGGPKNVVISPPPPGSVAEGDSLTAMCAATDCKPPCSYSWTQGNQQISATSRLTLKNINRSQTGNVYTCTATNSVLPTSKSKQFTLTVYYGPDSVQLNTSSPLTVKEGEDVSLICEATNCSPSCSFTLKFKSQIKSTSSVLSLNNIQRASAGDYTCTARNTNTQKSLDKTITLDVKYVTLKMSGSSSYAITNKSYTLTCTVARAVNFDNTIVFSRKTVESTFATLKQNLGVCSVVIETPAGYSAACGTGTSDANADTKEYTLVIDKVAKIDHTNWSCFLNTDHRVSSSLTVQPFGSATTDIDCMNGGRPGESLTLTCKISGTIVSGIRWIRPNGGSPQTVILCNTANTKCNQSGGIPGYTGTIVSSTQYDLTIQFFSTETDVGEWICRDGSTGAGPFSCNMNLNTTPDNPESQLSESTIIIIVVVAVLLAVAVPACWCCYKRRVNRQPKDEQEKTEEKTEKTTQEEDDESVLVDNPVLEQSN
ncbi:uncharacterized protein LOC121386728 [Gigantopelta aegis]|uniref:uncharacterized protein LOC121386728 n=1 Tax=Gigantopelta aegis TaxID=1735272 RepID=UPI001B88BCBD|nr:uncharacterized protein LOC121386728 [Gigantopelta aegis]XP_041373658.1 uncharacterized protein LOC121386728 [Gigantopelta aegis]